ncbi:hypothetical protein OHS33_32600 [Streptomyces sp. NBC_00536]|uniref:hypothetical protein n=1 Tax=Streptomyces sp. NBC_00536 TaxID=2975769 RepID=UPI002E7FDA66|nr:hypothetical protein [Streptomyces sp. NBC_00536]WUC82685.1 hypothetical protein OHS33_32600 [Streptomyces sp. NBC_00536]
MIRPVLLTLTGGAGAGKTTLATALAAAAPEGPLRVLHGDDYYYADTYPGDTPRRGIWRPDATGTPRLDTGDPRSADGDRLAEDADRALAVARVVVVEGLFARHVTPRVACARFDVFVDLPADLRLARKIRRKCLREGFPLDVLLTNYLDHRRGAHERHVEPVRTTCDLVVDARRDSVLLARSIWEAIAARSARSD